MNCNICGSKSFLDMNGRLKVKCSKCGLLERTRALYFYIDSVRINRDFKILHIAPEKGLFDAISKKIDPSNYVTADIQPERYGFSDCQYIDLCSLESWPSNHYDLIIHSHVLEHTPCNIAYTLYHLHRMMSPNGRHICVIPFTSGYWDEKFKNIDDEEKLKRFGQFDHVRRFGRGDISLTLGKIIKLPDHYDLIKDFSNEAVQNSNIPESHCKGFHMSTVLCLAKNDYLLSP